MSDACVCAAGVPDMIPHDLRRTGRPEPRPRRCLAPCRDATHRTQNGSGVSSERHRERKGDLGTGVEKLAGFTDGTIGGTKKRKARVSRFRQSSCRARIERLTKHAGVVKLADAPDSKSGRVYPL